MRATGILGGLMVLVLAGCAPAPPPSAADAPASPAPTPAESASTPRFADKVWRVESSSAVAPGTLYTFLSDGTLVISATQQSTSYGRWTYEKNALVMIEEGIAYPTDILALDERHFSIRSHNPGTPVDIALVLVQDSALPQLAPK